ncbi:hypothetical protein C5167_035944 [Papaver somniferum]|nr:hypothetical protein C5167_035944 [Papaver somniferum]
MMRVYKVLGRNKNYIEGSITKQYGVNEGAHHCAEILPDAKRNSFKCRGKIEKTCDAYEGPYPVGSQGKSCSLTNLRSNPNKSAYEDPFFFTGAANGASSISTTVGDDEYWNGDAQANDEYWDQYAKETTGMWIMTYMHHVHSCT